MKCRIGEIYVFIVIKCLLVFLGVNFLVGCDTMSGVSRSAKIPLIPDVKKIADHIKKYPEIDEVETKHTKGGRPLTFTGIQKPTEIYYIIYTGGKNVRGVIIFTKDYKGDIFYTQELTTLNRECPPGWIKATVPVMEKIEKDLERVFGLKSLIKNVKVEYFWAKPPQN